MIGIEEVMQRISLPEEARKTVRHMDLTQVAFEAWRTLFYEDMEEFLARWNQLPDKHAWALGSISALRPKYMTDIARRE